MTTTDLTIIPPSTAVDEPKDWFVQMAEEINRDITIAEQSRAEAHLAYSTHLQDAIRVGEKLREVRDAMDNSARFQAWIGRHLCIGRSQAYKYMRIAKHSDQIAKKAEELLERSAAPLSQNEAIRTLDGGTISAAQIEEIIRAEQHDLPNTRINQAGKSLLKKIKTMKKVIAEISEAASQQGELNKVDRLELQEEIEDLAADLLNLMQKLGFR
jgi:hypothetical protein